MEVSQRKIVHMKPSPELLQQQVKDLADQLFQNHLLDLRDRPKVPWKYYEKPQRDKTLSKQRRDGYSKLIAQNNLDKTNGYFKKSYFLLRSSLEDRFQKFLPYKVQHPVFQTNEEAIIWWANHLQDLTEEFDFYRKQENFIKKFNDLPYLDIAREYPFMLRFQPCSFDLPDGEDSAAWAQRTDAYLEKKCIAANIPHFVSCYDRQLTHPSIGFYRVLTTNKELATKLVADLQRTLNGIKMDVVGVESNQ